MFAPTKWVPGGSVCLLGVGCSRYFTCVFQTKHFSEYLSFLYHFMWLEHRRNCYKLYNCNFLFGSVLPVLSATWEWSKRDLKHFYPLRATGGNSFVNRHAGPNVLSVTQYLSQKWWKWGCHMHPGTTICIFRICPLLAYSQVVIDRNVPVRAIWCVQPRACWCGCISQKQVGQ